jgi:hypothetical protein
MTDIPMPLVIIVLVVLLYKHYRQKIFGFENFYKRYINTTKWRRRSATCRRLARYKCQTKGCKRVAHHAHHKDYRFLASWTPLEYLDLIALCRPCHSGLHRVEGGRLRQNPGVPRNKILRQTTDDWVSGFINRKNIAA